MFVDIHAHLLPDVDDGPPNWEISLEMLEQGERDGIEHAVCTPHIFSARDFDREPLLMARFEELVHRARQRGLSIVLYMGSEIYIQPDLQLHRNLSTLAQNQRYFLVEFPMNTIPDFVAKRFFDLVVDQNIPIIAHPERNGRILTKPSNALELVKRGALLQLNAGSLLGQFGNTVQRVAMQLMDANIVHVIATDAHDVTQRPFQLGAAFQLVKQKWGDQRARMLFFENPKSILSGSSLPAPEAIDETAFNKKVTRPGWQGRIQRLIFGR